MNASKYIFLTFILYCFAINFAFANEDTLIISPENETSVYQTNHQPEKIIIHNHKKTENTNKIQFEDENITVNNTNENSVNIEQNNHEKHESVPNRKTHSNIRKNNNINIIDDDLEVGIASDNSVGVVMQENEVKNTNDDTQVASTIDNRTASGIAYEAKLIEFNVQDKTKPIENKEEIHFNYNNLLYYLLYVFSLFFIFCLIGLIKEIIKRRKSKMKVVSNEKSN